VTAPAKHVWIGLAVVYVVWGSTYLGIRVAVETIPPFVLAATRFAIAGGVMLVAVAAFRRDALVRPTLAEWRDCFIVGSLLMGGGMGLVAWGEQTVPSGIAGLLIAMMPVWVAVFGRVFLGERLPPVAIVGIATGMVGVGLLVGHGVVVDGSLDPAGVGALVLSPICWSIGSLYSAHRAKLPKDPFLTTGLQMLCGSIVLWLFTLATGELAAFRPDEISSISLLAFVYLTVVGSLIAFTAYAWVLRHAPLPLVATYAFVNPVIAVFLGWLLLHETVAPIQIAAGAVTVVGVALIIVARSRLAPARPAAAARSRSDAEEPDPVAA
jgi:drug/metabolite transporter (DMT)-like permease